jgi:hypothetical protein
MIRPNGAGESVFVHQTANEMSERIICRPFSTSNPIRGCNFGLGAALPHSNTPSLRVAGFENEDDDEDEYEAPTGPLFQRIHRCTFDRDTGFITFHEGREAVHISLIGSYRFTLVPSKHFGGEIGLQGFILVLVDEVSG